MIFHPYVKPGAEMLSSMLGRDTQMCKLVALTAVLRVLFVICEIVSTMNICCIIVVLIYVPKREGYFVYKVPFGVVETVFTFFITNSEHGIIIMQLYKLIRLNTHIHKPCRVYSKFCEFIFYIMLRSTFIKKLLSKQTWRLLAMHAGWKCMMGYLFWRDLRLV